MKKILFILALLLTCFISTNIYAEANVPPRPNNGVYDPQYYLSQDVTDKIVKDIDDIETTTLLTGFSSHNYSSYNSDSDYSSSSSWSSDSWSGGGFDGGGSSGSW